MSYHYQMATSTNDFFDSTNYIPQMHMHNGYPDFYVTDVTPSMMTSSTSTQPPQPSENTILQGPSIGDHGGYGGWRQHDWSSTSPWSMGNQIVDHTGNGSSNGGLMGGISHGTTGNSQQMMAASHVVAETFRQIAPTSICYMDTSPARILSKKAHPPLVHRTLARSTPKPFRCQTCGKAFSQAANLTAHKRIHTGEKPFMCPVCNRPFSQSSSLVTHRRTHTGERPYPCAQCDKAFTDSSTLTKHLRTHTGHKPYVCSICMMKFTQSGNLHRHMKTHK